MTTSVSPRRDSTPLGVRARLNSLGNNSPRPKKATSSSTLTVQGHKKSRVAMRPTSESHSSSEKTDSDDEDAIREENADRDAEEQDALDRKLQHLQKMMTNDALGLVSVARPRDKGKSVDRGRIGPQRLDTLSSRSASQSVSSVSSPQGSIPDIPSPSVDSQPHSPISRHMSSKSSSPPAVSPRSALGQSHRRYGRLVDRTMSEPGSSHGSEASSFSDISGEFLSLCRMTRVSSTL